MAIKCTLKTRRSFSGWCKTLSMSLYEGRLFRAHHVNSLAFTVKYLYLSTC